MTLERDHLPQSYNRSIHYQNTAEHPKLIAAIRALLPKSSAKQIIVICIGTDRSTGDSLGPLVGMHLENQHPSRMPIYGTLEHPVHAMNLEETLATIHSIYYNPFIIAVDACLGKLTNVGKICVANGPVLPGAGVNKKLTPVGNMNITGIVNVSGYMEYSVLQNTRLDIVMKLSRVISHVLFHAIELPIVKESIL
ncbi:MAG: spore protease YyaC [Sporolactobacillus sp.]